jgi:hypothetical protein
MSSRTDCRHGSGLFRLARSDCFPQSEQGSGQVEVRRFVSQHGKTLEQAGRCRMPSRVGQIVVNHGWRYL